MRWTAHIALTLLVPVWPFAVSPAARAPRAPRAPRAAASRVAAKASEQDRFAGRYALGKNMPLVRSKNGLAFAREGGEAVRVLGGACSEVRETPAAAHMWPALLCLLDPLRSRASG